ncbi:hypothetical protein KDA23_06815 [Candidatus Saccharibacteria bacterium]|nr:hypothetical protein [Candidatus Saccharibacteria bacterium]
MKRIKAILRGEKPAGLPYDILEEVYKIPDMDAPLVRGNLVFYNTTDEKKFVYYRGADAVTDEELKSFGPMTIKHIDLYVAGEREFLSQSDIAKTG